MAPITEIGAKGQEICRPSDWTDVLKFFIFNYGLHALTVASAPGSGYLEAVTNTAVAIIFPFSGTVKAITSIYRFARSEPTPLKVAQKAGALCMVLPCNMNWEGYKWFPINPALTTIHGIHPINPQMLIRGDMGNQDAQYRLVRVPRNIEISPLIESHSENQQPELSCNYNIPKAIIAIIQIGYGAYELYMGSDHHIEKFGHTLPTSVPAMFLIHYKADGAVDQAQRAALEDIKACVSGAVGEASGEQPDHGLFYEAQSREKENLEKEWLLRIISLLLVIFVLAGPYLIINATTGFENGQSTKAQRVWLLSWLVAGQFFGGIASRNVSAFQRLCLSFLAAVLVCPAAVGGFVVVAKMILDDVVCKTL